MGVRTRRAHKHAKTHVIGFAAAGLLGFMALLMVALSFSVSGLVNSWLSDLPDYKSADAYLVAEPTEVYDSTGRVITEFYIQNRRSVEMDAISDYVIKGTIDTEDVRYYSHNGVDPQGIIRAALAQIAGGREGASTITQQLVRNTVLSEEQFEQSVKRKVREAYIAIEMEKVYSKEQILLMYLNTIYYGHSAYGIEAASITFFNKHANELSLAEAALLVGLPQSPSSYDPTQNPDLAVWRRNIVLDRMLTAGDITQEEHDAAQAEELVLNPGQSVMTEQSIYPYFTDYVKTLLLEDFDQDTIFKGGLKIYTTISPEHQAAAEDAVRLTLDNIGSEELEGALVSIDNTNGHILAMVGGRDYNIDQYNLATQARRQPGSSFKAITLAAAIEQGMNPTVTVNCNSPLQISPTWKLQNAEGVSYGYITLARATEVSSNTGYVQVAEAIGADSIVATAKKMGIKTDLKAYLSITLGTSGVPPVQMAEAYSTLATGGIHRDAVAITRIEDRNGNVVYEHEDNPSQAISPEAAYATTKVLQGVVTNGTAAQMNAQKAIYQPIAGKTGTTEDYRDLWFCGYTPQITVSVWCGYRAEQTVRVWGSVGHPYNTACPMFIRYVNAVLADAPYEDFPVAADPEYKQNSAWTFSHTASQGNNWNENASQYQQQDTSDEEEEQAERERQQREAAEQRAAEEEAARRAAEEEAQQSQPEPADTGGGTDTGGDTGGGDTGGGEDTG